MCISKIGKNKINVQIKKIEHGIVNICTQETEVSVYDSTGMSCTRLSCGTIALMVLVLFY